MKVTWLGTASLLIEGGGVKLLVDPYAQPYGVNRRTLRGRHLRGVDGIFITHPHFDHFHGIDRIMQRTEAPVYVCRRGVEIARKYGYDADRMTAVAAGETLRIGGMRIRVYQGRHVKFDTGTVWGVVRRAVLEGKMRRAVRLTALNRMFSMGEGDIFIYEFVTNEAASGVGDESAGGAEKREVAKAAGPVGNENAGGAVTREAAKAAGPMGDESTGRVVTRETAGAVSAVERVVVLGSAGDLTPPCALKGADLLVFPYAGKSEMADYAARLIREYRPVRVMLDHFDDAFPPLTCEMDVDALRRQGDVEAIVPQPGETVDLAHRRS